MATLPRVAAGGCLRGLLLQIVAGGLALGLLFVFAGVAAALPVGRGDRGMLLVGALACWALLCVGGSLAFLFVNRARIRARVDGAFAPLGLRGEAQMSIGRQFHGDWEGRRLDAFFSRGPTVEVFLAARAGSRMAVAPGDALARTVQELAGRDRFDAPWPELRGFSVSADEGPWARALLDAPGARAAADQLLDCGGRPETRILSVRPGAVGWTLRGTSLEMLEGGRLEAAVRTLGRFAEAVEAAPAPRAWREPSALEQRLRARRPGGAAVLVIVLGTLIFVGGLSVVAVALSFVLR